VLAQGADHGIAREAADGDQAIAAARRLRPAWSSALLSPAVTRRVIEAFARRPAPPAPGDGGPLPDLSARERDVVGGVVRGLSNAPIARELFLSEANVKTHVRSMLLKLGLHDRTPLVIAAYESGFARPAARGGAGPSAPVRE